MASFADKRVNELAEVDDWGSAWEECKRLGLKWGGRGMGGRATGRCTVQTKDVVVEGVTLAYLGAVLLDRTTLRLLQGRRYGLIGRNGVGKTTLMQRISTGTLPGFPPHLVVASVDQELPNTDLSLNAVQYLVKNNPQKLLIESRIKDVEDCDVDDEGAIEAQANLLSQLYDCLEEDGAIQARGTKILKDLGFSEARRNTPMSDLSGGWKMRVAIAMALSQEPNILLLDEPTNHLDVEGVEWLKSYLLETAADDEMTVLVTSHDRQFLDDICTDIIVFRHRHLTYYPGNYSDYEETKDNNDLHAARSQDLINKQRKQIEESVRKMQVTAAKGEGKNGMIASRKKKLERLGYEKNSHGHKFNCQRDGIRAGSLAEVAMGTKTGESRSLVDGPDRESSMKIPNPAPLGVYGSIVMLKKACISYQSEATSTATATATSSMSATPTLKVTSTAATTSAAAAPQPKEKSLGSKKLIKKVVAEDTAPSTSLLKNITFDLDQKSKIAIVGKNGCGKSTLMRAIVDAESGSNAPGILRSSTPGQPNLRLDQGEIWKISGMRIAYYQQNLALALPYDKTPLAYFTDIAPVEMKEQELRGHLGAFGLSGDIVLRQIGTLSGGQKSRIVLAQLTLNKPNVLFLDEPTNNLDLDAVHALNEALEAYEGAVIVASHDMAFVSDVTDTVYHLRQGELTRLEGGVDEYREYVQSVVEKQKKTIT